MHQDLKTLHAQIFGFMEGVHMLMEKISSKEASFGTLVLQVCLYYLGYSSYILLSDDGLSHIMVCMTLNGIYFLIIA